MLYFVPIYLQSANSTSYLFKYYKVTLKYIHCYFFNYGVLMCYFIFYVLCFLLLITCAYLSTYVLFLMCKSILFMLSTLYFCCRNNVNFPADGQFEHINVLLKKKCALYFQYHVSLGEYFLENECVPAVRGRASNRQELYLSMSYQKTKLWEMCKTSSGRNPIFAWLKINNLSALGFSGQP